MANQPKSKHIPRATIQRLATYVQVLENFSRDNVEVISSNPLAEACGVNGSQVRKDLAYFGEFGIRGVGYHVKSLIAAITSSLGVDREWRMALIGVGNMTIPAEIALNYPEAFGMRQSELIAAGLILFVITLGVNMIARWIVSRYAEFSGAN